jgi:hypothetical protein
MKLSIGQIIIWDGVQQVVTAVSETHARIATRSAKNALTKTVIEREQNEFFGQLHGKPISPESEWADNLLVMTASLGEEAAEFTKPIEEGELTPVLEAKKHRLEVGNAVIFLGHKRVAVHAERGFVKLLRIDGEVLVEENPLACIKLQPTATVNLENFLSVQGDARNEVTKQITAQEKEEAMKNNNKSESTPKPSAEEKKAAKAAKDAERYAAKKAAKEAAAAEKAAAKAAKPKKEKREWVDMSTRVAFVDEQIAAGKTLEEISPMVSEKYFYTPKGYADNLIASRMKRAAKKAAK